MEKLKRFLKAFLNVYLDKDINQSAIKNDQLSVFGVVQKGRFHGGCQGCTNELSVCPSCQYMNLKWNLPDKNPINAKHEKYLQELRSQANEAAANI